ncbi:hypothetical protein JCM10212_007058 [Sporobolomyces blumeae]
MDPGRPQQPGPADSVLGDAPPPPDVPPPASTSTSLDVADPAPPSTTETTAPALSKSALKRQRRQEAYEAHKLERRAREKQLKKDKQAEKRRLIDEGVLEPPERKKRKKGELPPAMPNATSKKWKGKKEAFGARIVLDVGFDELMTEKEVKSMSSQIAYCYSANRSATHPFPMLVTSFNGRLKQGFEKRKDHLNWKGVEWWDEGFEALYEARDGETEEAGDGEQELNGKGIEDSNGKETKEAGESGSSETARDDPVATTPERGALESSSVSVSDDTSVAAEPTATTSTAEDVAVRQPEPAAETPSTSTTSVPNRAATSKMGAPAGRPRSTCAKESVVYLTGDSPNVLTTIDPRETYVLGGIVDRNRHKFLCLDKANRLGVRHAQLPIGQHLPEMTTRKVLTVNQVFEIMVNYVESEREQRQAARDRGVVDEREIDKVGGDWREALRKVMPERKFDQDGRKKARAKAKQERQGRDVYVADEGGSDDRDDGADDDRDEGDEGEAVSGVYEAKDEDDVADEPAAVAV